jgi:UDP-N-acetyl-D-mannosaminuronate dehydrogenase
MMIVRLAPGIRQLMVVDQENVGLSPAAHAMKAGFHVVGVDTDERRVKCNGGITHMGHAAAEIRTVPACSSTLGHVLVQRAAESLFGNRCRDEQVESP